MESRREISLFACPVCAGELHRDDRALRCLAGHSFDIARQGHVNLLLAQQRRSHDPGYSKAMITARHDFFDTGGYEPVATALANIMHEHVPARVDRVVLDAGCGEGYYLRRLRELAKTTRPEDRLDICGVDVSKHGISIAAKHDPLGQYAVASSHALPVRPETFDVILTHFSPIFADCFHRALQPGGVVVVGAPGPKHLYGLKKLVYETAQPHDAPKEELVDHGFELIASHRVQYELQLRDARDVANLFAMTPFFWSASAETQARLAQSSELDTEVDVLVNVYRKVSVV